MLRSLLSHTHQQVNALLYRKSEGHWLRPHVDDRNLAYDTICTLSLGCDATMEFWKEARGLHQQGPTILHELPRLSLQVSYQFVLLTQLVYCFAST
jgi:hypothetical protein